MNETDAWSLGTFLIYSRLKMMGGVGNKFVWWDTVERANWNAEFEELPKVNIGSR